LVLLVYYAAGYFFPTAYFGYSLVGLFLFSRLVRNKDFFATLMRYSIMLTTLCISVLLLGVWQGVQDTRISHIYASSWHSNLEEQETVDPLRRLTFEANFANPDSSSVRIRRITPVFRTEFSPRVVSGDTTFQLKRVLTPRDTLSINGHVWIRSDGLPSTGVQIIQSFHVEFEKKHFGLFWW
jgi:hypothetical protein